MKPEGTQQDRITKHIEAVKAEFKHKAPGEKETEIIGLADAYCRGRVSLECVTVLSIAIDPENFRRILSDRLPDFENFLAGIEAKLCDGHSHSHE